MHYDKKIFVIFLLLFVKIIKNCVIDAKSVVKDVLIYVRKKLNNDEMMNVGTK